MCERLWFVAWQNDATNTTPGGDVDKVNFASYGTFGLNQWGTRPPSTPPARRTPPPRPPHVKPCFCDCVFFAVQQQQSARLADLHRKSQLWRGIVSIALIEGRNLIPMDANGLSDPYAKFRLGQQKYRSKVSLALARVHLIHADAETSARNLCVCVATFPQTVPKTLSPQWREQFDLHLYEESGGVLEITVWDRDTGRRDDFIGRSVAWLCRQHHRYGKFTSSVFGRSSKGEL